ncbi:MAG: substrate-binding domain-containing protein [Rectinemataceae bacterium]|jgi:tungstate transport system substrate-binding protein
MKQVFRIAALAGTLMAAAALAGGAQGTASPAMPRLRLATTTSTEQSGLLAAILPAFEKKTGYRVDVVAVGTGASLKIGEKGDCDVVLVHARALEDAFMASGFGAERRDVMYNDFVVLGPASDPARVAAAKSAVEAFSFIFASHVPFVSRGDKSGTDVKEKDIWKASGLAPTGASWYKEIGQGMSQAILMAEQIGGYTLADRATWLSMKARSSLAILNQGDKILFNPYGIISVSPAKWPSTNIAGATALIDWITGSEGRALIAAYAIGGEQCFYLY